MSDHEQQVIGAIKATLENLSLVFDHYSRRDGQIQMINDIRRILVSEQTKVGVCEAGTGIGKTLAYLIAAVPTAKCQGKPVVISTATVALQDQILHKDLPLFAKVYPGKLSFSLLKGKGRFVCRERLAAVVSCVQGTLDFDGEAPLFDAPPTETDIAIMTEMSAQLADGAWNGDKDSWRGARLPAAIWETIASDQHQCKVSYPKHAQCPYHQHRDEMLGSDIIVANHALVAKDIEMGGGILLPSVQEAIYIFDEAHQLPGIVRNARGATLSIEGFASVLESLKKNHDNRKFTKLLDAETAKSQIVKLDNAIAALAADLNAIAMWSEHARAELLSDRSLYRFEFGHLPQSFLVLVTNMLTSCSGLQKEMNRIHGKISELVKEGNSSAGSALSDVGFYSGRLDYALQCLSCLERENESGVQPAKWVELDSKERFLLGAGEVSVGPFLKDAIWSDNSGIILTSATLKSLGQFHDFARDTGLDFDCSAYFRSYPSPFDYQRSQLIVPDDIPFAPNTEEYKVWLKTNILTYIKGQPSTLVLFTSRALMEEIRTHIEGACTTSRTLLQCQGDALREVIIENHRKALERDMSSVLFGLDSFSEGLDLQGELLVNLIITRIPFEVPDSPLSAALMEFEKAQGNLPFITVTLPMASRALTQSIGRLIRSERDVGRCVILDKRIITKRYGAELLDALPPFQRNLPCQ